MINTREGQDAGGGKKIRSWGYLLIWFSLMKPGVDLMVAGAYHIADTQRSE